MADKRKEGTGQAKRTVVRRRRTTTGGAAGRGRIAVRRETAAYRRAAADEHAMQVRDRIEAALAEGRRVREDIEQRIDQRLKEEEEGKAGKLITKLAAKTARLRAVKPPGPEPRGAVKPPGPEFRGKDEGEDKNRPKASK